MTDNNIQAAPLAPSSGPSNPSQQTTTQMHFKMPRFPPREQEGSDGFETWTEDEEGSSDSSDSEDYDPISATEAHSSSARAYSIKVKTRSTADLPVRGSKDAPKTFKGKYSQVEHFVRHYERLLNKYRIISDADKCECIIEYCSSDVGNFIRASTHYAKKNWPRLKHEILKYYDAERARKKYKPSDVRNYSLKMKNKPIYTLTQWKQYYTKYKTIAGGLRQNGDLSAKNYAGYFWVGIHRDLRDLLATRLSYMLPGHNPSKPYKIDQVTAVAEHYFHRDRFDKMFMDAELFNDDSDNEDYDSGSESDTEEDSDSEIEITYRSKSKPKSKKKKPTKKKKSTSKKEENNTGDPGKGKQSDGSKGNTEVEGLIRKLNGLSLNDPDYGPTYYRVMSLDTSGLAAKCILREPPSVLNQSIPYQQNWESKNNVSRQGAPPFNNSRIPDQRNNPSEPPMCYGCNKLGHRINECTLVQSLIERGITMRDPVTGHMMMKDGRWIRRNPGESLGEAAERMAPPKSLFVSSGTTLRENSSNSGKEVEMFYSTVIMDDTDDDENSDAYDDDTSDGYEGETESEDPRPLVMWNDQHTSSYLEEVDTDEEEDTVLWSISVPSDSEEDPPQMYGADRTNTSTRTARKEAIDNVLTRNRPKALQRHMIPENKPKRVTRSQGTIDPQEQSSIKEQPSIKRSIKENDAPIKEPIPFDARKVRFQPEVSQNVEIKDINPRARLRPEVVIKTSPVKRSTEETLIRPNESSRTPEHRPTPANSQQAPETLSQEKEINKNIPEADAHTQGVEKTAEKSRIGRQSEISSTVNLDQLTDKMLDITIPVSLRQILVASREINQKFTDKIKPKNVKAAVLLNPHNPFVNQISWPRQDGVLIRVRMEHRGKDVFAIIDTGSQLDVIREAVADRIVNIPVDTTQTSEMGDVNGGQGFCYGLIPNVELQCGNALTRADLFVAEKVPFDLLLGRPWQRNNFVSIDERIKGTYLVFKNPKTGQPQHELLVVAEQKPRTDLLRTNKRMPHSYLLSTPEVPSYELSDETLANGKEPRQEWNPANNKVETVTSEIQEWDTERQEAQCYEDNANVWTENLPGDSIHTHRNEVITPENASSTCRKGIAQRPVDIGGDSAPETRRRADSKDPRHELMEECLLVLRMFVSIVGLIIGAIHMQLLKWFNQKLGQTRGIKETAFEMRNDKPTLSPEQIDIYVHRTKHLSPNMASDLISSAELALDSNVTSPSSPIEQPWNVNLLARSYNIDVGEKDITGSASRDDVWNTFQQAISTQLQALFDESPLHVRPMFLATPQSFFHGLRKDNAGRDYHHFTNLNATTVTYNSKAGKFVLITGHADVRLYSPPQTATDPWTLESPYPPKEEIDSLMHESGLTAFPYLGREGVMPAFWYPPSDVNNGSSTTSSPSEGTLIFEDKAPQILTSKLLDLDTPPDVTIVSFYPEDNKKDDKNEFRTLLNYDPRNMGREATPGIYEIGHSTSGQKIWMYALDRGVKIDPDACRELGISEVQIREMQVLRRKMKDPLFQDFWGKGEPLFPISPPLSPATPNETDPVSDLIREVTRLDVNKPQDQHESVLDTIIEDLNEDTQRNNDGDESPTTLEWVQQAFVPVDWDSPIASLKPIQYECAYCFHFDHNDNDCLSHRASVTQDVNNSAPLDTPTNSSIAEAAVVVDILQYVPKRKRDENDEPEREPRSFSTKPAIPKISTNLPSVSPTTYLPTPVTPIQFHNLKHGGHEGTHDIPIFAYPEASSAHSYRPPTPRPPPQPTEDELQHRARDHRWTDMTLYVSEALDELYDESFTTIVRSMPRPLQNKTAALFSESSTESLETNPSEDTEVPLTPSPNSGDEAKEGEVLIYDHRNEEYDLIHVDIAADGQLIRRATLDNGAITNRSPGLTLSSPVTRPQIPIRTTETSLQRATCVNQGLQAEWPIWGRSIVRLQSLRQWILIAMIRLEEVINARGWNGQFISVRGVIKSFRTFNTDEGQILQPYPQKEQGVCNPLFTCEDADYFISASVLFRYHREYDISETIDDILRIRFRNDYEIRDMLTNGILHADHRLPEWASETMEEYVSDLERDRCLTRGILHHTRYAQDEWH